MGIKRKIVFNLDKEEQEIEDNIDKWRPVAGAERRKIEKMFKNRSKGKVIIRKVINNKIHLIF